MSFLRPKGHTYRKVIIVGNGFDLNLGLPTSYNNFVTSTVFRDLVKSGSKVAQHIQAVKNINNWVDIELELVRCANAANPSFKSEYAELCNALCEYLNAIDVEKVADKNSLAWKILHEASFTHTNHNIKETLVVNFNYTNCFDILCKSDVYGFNFHGTSSDKKIIFGVHDDVKIKPESIFVKKSVSKHMIHDCLVSDIMAKANKIIFFGHSLGLTDHTQFIKFFQSTASVKPKEIFFYHHSDDSRIKLFAQLDDMTNQSVTKFMAHHKVQFISISSDDITPFKMTPERT